MKRFFLNSTLTARQKIFLSAACIVMASFVFAASHSDAVDFSGTWLGKTNVPSLGADELTLVLNKEKDSYIGTVVDSLEIIAPDTPIQNVVVEGDVITFMFPLVDSAMLSCNLTLKADKMDGYWTHPSGSRGNIIFEKSP